MTDRPNPSGTLDEVTLRAFERSLPMALMRAREAVMAHFRPILASHGVTEQQWRVLRALIASDGPCSVGELIEQTFLLGPSLSRMLVSMEESDLIARTTAPRDRRQSAISITATGRLLVDTVAPLSEAVYDRISAQFQPGELEQLHELLARTASL